MISPNIIIPYDGTNASIPSGWVRETTLDNKFPKGCGTQNPNLTGGSATHSHTSPSHTHTMINHTHSYSLLASSTVQSDGENSSGNIIANANHTHTSNTSGAISGGSLTGSATIGDGDNNPPYYTVIFIKASNYQLIPQNGVILSSSTSRSGLTFHSASANRFLKGADTDEDAGDTGGSLTHDHTYNHTHDSVNHSHLSANSSAANNPLNRPGSGNNDNAAAGHKHPVTLSNSSTPVNTENGSFTSENVQPAFRTLNPFVNNNATGVMPKVGDIAMWLGSLEDIPTGWLLCNGTSGTPNMEDMFLKIPTSASSSTTGGGNTHAHTGVASHTHTATGTHTHSGTCSTGASAHQNGAGYDRSAANHIHTVSSVSSVTATWNNTTISTNTVNNEPEYRTVAYIQMKFNVIGSAPLIAIL